MKIEKTMQRFVCQPNLDGKFEIASWDEIEKQYIPMPKEVYLTENEAQMRAQKLNEEYKKDLQKNRK